MPPGRTCCNIQTYGRCAHRLWFDNTSTIVTKVLKEGHRDLTDKFCVLKDITLYCVFCNPDAGNEKETLKQVGYHRRNMLVQYRK
jgi:hypothetical protein